MQPCSCATALVLSVDCGRTDVPPACPPARPRSAILDNLFFCICDAGDSVLIPAPYYPAFDNDLQAKCDLHPTPFFLDEAGDVDGQLEAAAAAAAAAGRPVRALLVTNPSNPLGIIYSERTVRAMVAWCLRTHTHYVR
jgi:aspartate/methionine/tyrosine aminotransferase